MIGPTYYSFAGADEAAKGAAMLEAEDASRYGTVLLGPVMQPTGETDAEGFPVMEDAGLGYILAVLDRQSPDPVPGWEAAQVKAELVPHEWAGRRVDGLLMDEDAPDAAEPIQVAARPGRDDLLRLREARIARREANAEVWRLRAAVEGLRERIGGLNAEITALPDRRTAAVARITAAQARRTEAVAERDVAIAVAQNTQASREDRQAARDERDVLIAEIEAIDAALARDRDFRDAVAGMLTALRAERDALVVERDAVLAALTQARTDRAAAIAALGG